MTRLIPAADRLVKARALIEKARKVPVPPLEEGGRGNLAFVAEVKDIMRQARDLIKFIPLQPTATAEMKAEVVQINQETARVEKEILHPNL